MKKCGEDVRPADVAAPAEEMEKKQKILLWLMEGQKELVQHKRSSYGSVPQTAAAVILPVGPIMNLLFIHTSGVSVSAATVSQLGSSVH